MARGVQWSAAMRSYRLALDRMTGDIVAVGRDGRRYSIADLEEAEAGAARGDRVALEVIREVELTPPGGAAGADGAPAPGATGPPRAGDPPG